MLRLILGRRQSGKTKYCTDKARLAVEAGKKVIFLVPEQYSFECQRSLLMQLGPQISNRITIHGFSSLCTEVGNTVGGNAGKTVDDGLRYILVKRSLAAVKDSLSHYARFVNSDEFAKKLLLNFSELKQASANPGKLRETAEKVGAGLLSEKLSDLALIMGAYDSLVKRQFIEPFDLIERTVDRMPDNSFFENTVIFADGFKGFTGSQYKLISRMTAGCDDFYAALCCDSDIPVSETDVFKNVSEAAARLKEIAESGGIGVAKPVILDRCPENRDIAAFERFAAGRGNAEELKGVKSVKTRIFRTVYDEADAVIKDIRRQVRENGRKYRDFVIITRSGGAYTGAFSSLAEKYGVPLFCDRRTPASELPVSVFVLSALRSADRFDTEDILAYLKTGLAGLSAAESAELENYAFVWDINGKKWLDEAVLDPSGYKDLDIMPDERETEHIALLRDSAIKPLLKLRGSDRKNAESIGLAVMTLIDGCGTVTKLKDLADRLEQNGNLAEAGKQRKGYDVFIDTLNKVVSASGYDIFGLSEFADILEAALSFESVGEIPQKKDEVLLGTADRIRTDGRKVSYIAGINEGVFPASVNDTGLLSESERKTVIDNGIGISDGGIGECIDEQFMLYYSLISASDEINLSCSLSSADGSAAEPSELFRTVSIAFGKELKAEDTVPDVREIEAKEPAFKAYALNMKLCNSTVSALKEVFEHDEEYKDRCKKLDSYKNGERFGLSEGAVSDLYGGDIRLSPSSINCFSDCKFNHFCKYGLKVVKLEKADFDARIRGKMIHYVLEHFVTDHKNDIGTLTDETVINEAAALCDEYAKGVMTEGANAEPDAKFRYMTEIIKRICSDLLTALNNEFAQSDFSPAECEYELKSRKGIPVKFNNFEGTVSFKGTVDRVDTTSDGMIRVVDYKSGTKDFSLDRLLCGQDAQMLLYLYFCVTECADEFKADHPAGVLYFPARKTETSEDGFIKMKGIIDPDTVTRMEKDGKGKIVPVSLTSGGEINKRNIQSAVTADEFRVIFGYLEKMLRNIGADILSGHIEPLPLYKDDDKVCKYCDYKSVCRIASSVEPTVPEKHTNAETVEIMKAETEDEA